MMVCHQVASLQAEAERESAADDVTTTSTSVRCVPPKLLSECLLAVTSLDRVDDADAQRLALETLVDAHHPCISTS